MTILYSGFAFFLECRWQLALQKKSSCTKSSYEIASVVTESDYTMIPIDTFLHEIHFTNPIVLIIALLKKNI